MARDDRYFVNAWVDHGAMGLFSVALFGAALALPDGAAGPAAWLAGLLQWVVNWPHFSATCYRLYRTPENRRQYPVTAYVVPVVILSGVAASLLLPSTVAPAFVKLFMLWSPYHFSAQSLGLSLVYSRRFGYAVSDRERLALSAFVYGTFLVSTARAETAATAPSYFGVALPGLGLPDWLVTGCEIVMYGGGAVFLTRVAWRWLERGERPPFILFVPALAQFTWFVVGWRAPAFYPFVPLFHSLQYLLIAWVMGLKESGAVSRGRETFRWYFLNVAGGGTLFVLFPHGLKALGYPIEFATAVAIAGVQLHHFFVDGVIWKLRSAANANPLFVSLRRAA